MAPLASQVAGPETSSLVPMTAFSLVAVLTGPLPGAIGDTPIDVVNRFTHLEGTADATG